MFALAVLLALAPVGTADGRWVSIGDDVSGDSWWMDAYSSPKERGTSGSPWFKRVPRAGKASPLSDVMLHIAVSCSARQYATLDVVHHYRDGTNDESHATIAEAKFIAPAPETTGEWIVRIICDK